jgi:DNA-binding winged helix-turn-helix (wHTH) protein/tetratricopeptide (TPR) repeat protein
MQKTEGAHYRFGNVEIHLATRRVQVDGQHCPLEPKTFELLKFLVENRGRAVSKEEIVAAVWPGTFVTDNSLTRAVTKIRKALGENSRETRFIETLPKIGYRFSAECEEDQHKTPADGLASEPLSIAILPVASRAGDSELDYLAEGFTDGAIRLLSAIPELKVLARATVYRFKNTTEDALTFARSLGVKLVLVGELKRVSGRLAYDVELAEVNDRTIVMSRQYWPDPAEWMDLQADLALDVARALHFDLDRGQSAWMRLHPTISAEAYRLFLRGEFLARRLAPPSLTQALELFEKAVKLDDKFALAWAELAQTHVVLGLYFMDPNVHMPAAQQAAHRALELDDSLQVAHACMAIVYLMYEWDFAAAEKELATAAICRQSVLTFSCLSHLLTQTGRGRDAEGQIRHTLAFDPRNPTLVSELGCISYYRQRYEHAIDHFRASQELDPRSPVSCWGLGKSLAQMGRYEDALAALRAFKARSGFEPPVLTAEIGYVLGLAGCRQEALQTLRELQASTAAYVNPYFFSTIYLGMGDLDQAFDWLERAYEMKSTFIISIPTEPKWQPVQSDPRYQAILTRIGFAAV